MYQIPIIDRTTLSRSAGPVCMTRAAMRPAKSFWKNVQPCRTTCQWFCQRTRLVSPGTSTWLVTSACARCASGRSTISSSAMPASWRPASRQIVSGRCEETSVTIRPMNTGIAASSSATTNPVTKSAASSRGIWRTKCQ